VELTVAALGFYQVLNDGVADVCASLTTLWLLPIDTNVAASAARRHWRDLFAHVAESDQDFL